MNSVVGRGVALAALVCVLALAATSGAALGPADAAGVVGAVDEPAETANETVRHQHPDEYADDRGADATAGWLADRLADQLGDSAASISEGEYELAREFVGEEYRERLGQYVEVAGETDEPAADDEDEDDEPTTEETYEEAADAHERLAELVEQYRQTAAEYEQARDAGDEERALALARELEALAEEIEALGGEIRVHHERLEFATGSDLSEATDRVNETTDEVRETQLTIRGEQFVETRLTVEPADDAEPTASIVEPLSATGAIETADNSTPANETIRLVVDGEPIDVETDADGAFAFEYRPAPTTPLQTEAVEVRYVPDDASAYLGSAAALNVTLEPVDAQLAIEDATTAGGYGDPLTVTGSVTADGEPVDAVPLEATLGDEPVGTWTATDGAFEGNGSVPAAVPAGDRPLTVAVALDDHALGGDEATTTVSIAERDTDLALAATVDDDALSATVTLETADGDPVANQPVALTLAGESVGTVTTGPDGEATETIALPADAAGELRLEAAFDGAGTNLADARAETTVTAGSPPAEGRSWLPWLAVGALALAGLAGVGWWWRRRAAADPEAPTEPVVVVSATDAESGPERPADGEVVDAVLSRARDSLAAGEPDEAVRLGYTAVREALAPEEADRALTHWEFYATYRERTEADARLRSVVEAYERAAFSPGALPEEVARRVLPDVRRLCERSATDEGVESTGVTMADD